MGFIIPILLCYNMRTIREDSSMNFSEFDEKYFSANSYISAQEILGDHVVDESHPTIQKMIAMHEYLLTKEERLSDYQNLPPLKLKGLNETSQSRFEMYDVLVDYCISKGIELPFEIAAKIMFALDSFNRPALLIKLHQVMKFGKWMETFVENWERCDGCSMYINEFREIFKDADIHHLMKTYFPKKTYRKWLKLPELCRVYRGAFESCKNGLSWSLDHEVAFKFANTYHNMSHKGVQYFRASCQMHQKGLDLIDQKLGERASLYTAYIDRTNCFLFENRSEKELFYPFVVEEDEIEDMLDHHAA